MRIIGGRDYYDSAAAWGRDETIIFLRNKDRVLSPEHVRSVIGIRRTRLAVIVGVEGERGHRRVMPEWHHLAQSVTAVTKGVGYDIATGAVILAGTLHRGLLVTARARCPGIETGMTGHFWFWQPKAFTTFLSERGLVAEPGRPGLYSTWAGGGRAQVEYLDLDAYLEPEVLPDPVRARLVEERITILSRDPRDPQVAFGGRHQVPWKVDRPTLKGMEFMKAVDPATAFQEISMWKGGVLGADGPPMIEITDDKVKIAKHGMDETSFRKPKAAV